MYTLICEGACNRSLPNIDRAIVTLTKYDAEPVGDSAIWGRQRALQHTPHDPVSPYRAKCVECGTERRYGNF